MKKEKPSGFFQSVYDIVENIPEGKVATYGQIALMAGRPRAARQVGYAISSVSSDRDLPCHRVVNRFGELAPEHAFGDKRIQRRILEEEGITFLPDGTIDLDKHFWNGVKEKKN